jgi:hypothetical protein
LVVYFNNAYHANLDVAYSYEKESFVLVEAIDISICM